MSKFIGRRGRLGAAKEAVRGVGLNPTLWVPRVTMSLDDKIEDDRSTPGLGRIEDSEQHYVTQHYSQGLIEGDIPDATLGLFLLALFGSESGAGSNPTTHTYTLAQTNQHQSLSIYYDDPDINTLFPLCMIDSFKMEIKQNQLVNYSIGFMGKGADDWLVQTPSFTAIGLRFLSQHLSFKLAAAVGNLAAASKVTVKELTLEIQKNVLKNSTLGTVEPTDLINQDFMVTGSVTLDKADQTFRNNMLNGTYQAMEIKLTNTAQSILTFQLPKVEFTQWEQDRSLDTLVTQKFNFKGNYDSANNLAVISTATLANNQAGSY